MTALVNIINMNILDNPTSFSNPLQIEITFESTGQLEEDIEWKVVYVGSAENSAFDQVLAEIMVGPIPLGVNSFILQAEAPDPSLIPQSELLGITAILVTGSYKDQEFARVGYYVNNEYRLHEDNDEIESGELVSPLDVRKIFRTVLADKPRVTRFQIQWTGDVVDSGEYFEKGSSIEYMDDGYMTGNLSGFRSPQRRLTPAPCIVSPDRSLGDILMAD